MLFYANFIHKVGGVDQGTTTTNYDAEEQERAPSNLYSTIQAAAVSFDWKDHTFNLIDTPKRVVRRQERNTSIYRLRFSRETRNAFF